MKGEGGQRHSAEAKRGLKAAVIHTLYLLMILVLLHPVLYLLHLHLHHDPLCEGVQEGRHTPEPPHHIAPLEPLPPPQEGAVVKHVLGVGVEGPEVALAGVAGLPGHLDEAVVETEVVADAVLPGGVALVVVGEAAPDELADAVEGEALVGALDDGHGDHGDVAVGRLDVLALALKDTALPCQCVSFVTLLLKGVFLANR